MPHRKNKKNETIVEFDKIQNSLDSIVFLLKEDIINNYYDVFFDIFVEFNEDSDNVLLDESAKNVKYLSQEFVPERIAGYVLDKNITKIVSIIKNEFIRNNYDVNLLFDNLSSLINIIKSKLIKELSTKELIAVNEYYIRESFTFKFIKNKASIFDMIKNMLEENGINSDNNSEDEEDEEENGNILW